MTGIHSQLTETTQLYVERTILQDILTLKALAKQRFQKVRFTNVRLSEKVQMNYYCITYGGFSIRNKPK